MLGRLFGRRPAAPAAAAEPVVSAVRPSWLPHDAFRMPHGLSAPNPDALEPGAAGIADDALRAGANHWRQRLLDELGPRYAATPSEHFALLAPEDPRFARVLLAYAERCRKHILAILAGVAQFDERVTILVVHDADTYYRYNASLSDEGGHFATSGGIFVDAFWPHLVFVADELHVIEPTLAHELAHAGVRRLRLPLWLNEGMAVLTEQRIAPRGPGLYRPDELTDMHRAFWNDATLQEFWSGTAFQRPDEGNLLSYDLAQRLVMLLSRDFDRFRAFALDARIDDAGHEAALRHVGIGLDQALEIVIDGAG